MIVVADTSVILNLCRVQHENLLRQLFKRVVIPTKVAEEFVRLGIRTIGIVRILIDARDKNLIPSVATVLDRLENEANFWISEDLRLQALKLVGE